MTTDHSPPVRVDVSVGSGTAIWIGDGITERLASLLDAQGVGARRFVVSSPTIWRLHGARIQAALGKTTAILIPEGERAKNLRSVSRVYDGLIAGGADRGSALVAVGGGVIGDTAGFAAATFLRGITLAQVPTTLLAQVDSAIGGKVGVNHPLGKNLIGAFHQPAVVSVDPQLLGTLPRREFRSGLYEVVKYGMIASRPLFDHLATNLRAVLAREPAALLPLLVDSCRIKADVVSRDEREAGLRRILNFGHTVGHALEAVTAYRRYRHGEAIAYGMLAAAELGVTRGALGDDQRLRLTQIIAALGPLPPLADVAIDDVLEAMGRDKKVVSGTLHFVIAVDIGRAITVTDVTETELRNALERLGLR